MGWDISYPTLTEILSDVASSPFTLSAFTSHLSQHRCEESLLFTQDAASYASFYNSYFTRDSSPEVHRRVQLSWDGLMQTYVVPCGPREINLSASQRDYLLALSSASQPPHPSVLDESRRNIYDLMNDSLLGPFFESVTHTSHIQLTSTNAFSAIGQDETGNDQQPLLRSLSRQPRRVLGSYKDKWRRVWQFAALHE